MSYRCSVTGKYVFQTANVYGRANSQKRFTVHSPLPNGLAVPYVWCPGVPLPSRHSCSQRCRWQSSHRKPDRRLRLPGWTWPRELWFLLPSPCSGGKNLPHSAGQVPQTLRLIPDTVQTSQRNMQLKAPLPKLPLRRTFFTSLLNADSKSTA